ncbi:MAG TPA: ABC transporter permease [Methanofastidiosum sp.]|nr:ABC transporter permease [Methanofastidiosum sp.]HOG73397.1 ABC transporter permease [Methanofastidiosum sp.]
MVAIVFLIDAIIEQLSLVFTSLIIDICVAFPLAILSVFYKRFSYLVLTITNMAQAIPSFALVAIIVPLAGIGFLPGIVAIVLGSILPIIKNMYIGLTKTNPALIDSGRGMGLTDLQLVRYIRLPLAYPAIFAGLKFSAIIANGIAVLTAIIGSGGLGRIIFEGLASFNVNKTLSGAIPAILIALSLDLIFSIAEKKLKSRSVY